jgi:inner membrane protein
MPSPFGHALAGITIALGTDEQRRTSWRWETLTIVCGCLAASPDLDLLVRGAHRTATHSFAAVGIVAVVVGVVTRIQSGRVDWRVTIACAVAYASHLLMDWLGVDLGWPAGIQLFWPFSDHHFISGIPLFEATERRHLFSQRAIVTNMLAAAREVLILAPIFLLVLVRWRRRRGTRPSARVVGRE